jgi:hypothetical protein
MGIVTPFLDCMEDNDGVDQPGCESTDENNDQQGGEPTRPPQLAIA